MKKVAGKCQCPFLFYYGFYRHRCLRCGNIANAVQPPSDGCNDKEVKVGSYTMPPAGGLPAGGSSSLLPVGRGAIAAPLPEMAGAGLSTSIAEMAGVILSNLTNC
jgi:hypothetical protein